MPESISSCGEPNAPTAILSEALLESFLEPAPPPEGREPHLVVVMGPIASGKTTLRRERYANHVALDPADLFLRLTDEDRIVPENIAGLVAAAGGQLARRAFGYAVHPTRQRRGRGRQRADR